MVFLLGLSTFGGDTGEMGSRGVGVDFDSSSMAVYCGESVLGVGVTGLGDHEEGEVEVSLTDVEIAMTAKLSPEGIYQEFRAYDTRTESVKLNQSLQGARRMRMMYKVNVGYRMIKVE